MTDYNTDIVIEIPYGSNIKYEYDEDNSKIRCDRVLSTSMHYPGNYGYIPNTLSGDGDPLDALLITEDSLQPNTIIKSKIIGVLVTKDESGQDEKIICVPSDKVDSRYSSINTLSDVSQNVLEKIKHFFTHYKDNEKNKWVIVENFLEKEEAIIILKESIERKNNISV